MDAFQALAEPRRRQLVELLARRGRLSASEICREFDVTPQAISQHLRVLRDVSVLRMEKDAQRRLYTFNPQSMDQIQSWTAGMTRIWNNRFDRLEHVLKENEK